MISQAQYEEQLKLLEPLYKAEAEEFQMRSQMEYNSLQVNESNLRKAFKLAERTTQAYLKDSSGDVRVRISMVEGRPEDIHLPRLLEDQLNDDLKFFQNEWRLDGKQHQLLIERFKEFVGVTVAGFFDNQIIIDMEKRDCRLYREAKYGRILKRHELITSHFGGQANVPTELFRAMENELLQLTEQWGEDGIFFNSILKRSAERLMYKKPSWDHNLKMGEALINDIFRLMGNFK